MLFSISGIREVLFIIIPLTLHYIEKLPIQLTIVAVPLALLPMGKWEVCVSCETSIPIVKLPMGNHYGYITKNKRITQDVSRTKS